MTEAPLKCDRAGDERDQSGERQDCGGRAGPDDRGDERKRGSDDTEQPQGGDERVAARRDRSQLSARSAPAITTRWISLVPS